MKLLMVLAALMFAVPASSTTIRSPFKAGPVFDRFGPHAPVEGMGEISPDTEFSIAFDVAQAAEDGTPNRGFESAARFTNMHVAAGVDPDNIRLVVVVHGKASLDLLNNAAWAARQPVVREGGEEEAPDNPSAAMIAEMMDAGVRFVLCGQSGAANEIAQDDLVPGVETALSAMTAHAILQQRGYTVNPF